MSFRSIVIVQSSTSLSSVSNFRKILLLHTTSTVFFLYTSLSTVLHSLSWYISRSPSIEGYGVREEYSTEVDFRIQGRISIGQIDNDYMIDLRFYLAKILVHWLFTKATHLGNTSPMIRHSWSRRTFTSRWRVSETINRWLMSTDFASNRAAWLIAGFLGRKVMKVRET